MSDSNTRKEESLKVRNDAAELAYNRVHPEHHNNGDEKPKYDFMMSFSKGLHHDETTGLVKDRKQFKKFRKAIDDGFVHKKSGQEFVLPFNEDGMASPDKLPERKWEAPTAGYVHSLQGPDAQAVTMPPAPALGSIELAYEMAEVYELSLLRDVPFKGFSTDESADALTASTDRLNCIGYRLTGGERNYEIGHPCVKGFNNDRSRKNSQGSIDAQNAFRGSSPGVNVGPYLSQFMLIGNASLNGSGKASDGLIQYGAQQIDQRVPVATPGLDYMTFWDEWLAAQNGAIAQNSSTLYQNNRRFITTPRDLATYVHHDALYQSYLNALLIMMGPLKVPFDPAFKFLSGSNQKQDPNFEVGGFALWGGPHILSLVTEVATRALKAVRWQKFNTHMRLRPEALAARIHKADIIDDKLNLSGDKSFASMRSKIQETVDAIREKNSNKSTLLPMAFQEGSPMHPSYGAGHATVAGACVTILKAFFDGEHSLDVTGECVNTAYVASDDGEKLEKVKVIGGDGKLTVNGELNKLAANISIGRNMAGVHYYSDYFDSLRMGEAIAIGILEEQALCYPKDVFTLTLETFDGDNLTINREKSLLKIQGE